MARRKGKANSGITNSAGSAGKLAMTLFGLTGSKRMETPDQRLWVGEVLALSQDPQLKQLSRIIQNPMPEDRLTSVSTLAERLGITARQFTHELKNLMKDEGFVRMSQHLPEIMEQVAIDAKSKYVECHHCGGTGEVITLIKTKRDGEIEETNPCDPCKGTGKIYELGSVERLRMIFETFDLIGKKAAGVNIMNLNNIQPTESLSELSQSLGPLLEGNVK